MTRLHAILLAADGGLDSYRAELRQRAMEFVSAYLALGPFDYRVQAARRNYREWAEGVL